MRPIPIRVVAFALSIAFGSVGCADSSNRSAKDGPASDTLSSTRMADGTEWTTENLNVNIVPSYCYENAESNCRQYGRLYTWESARRACESLTDGWQLPSSEEWRQIAKHYGGLREESEDLSKTASHMLLIGGSSGFNARLGGGRQTDGQYARLGAHGLYWSASESEPGRAWFYNFGQAGLSPHRNGAKDMALSVRCVRQ